jgi:hypothetical protein
LGALDVDFGTAARRDVFVQAMPKERNNPSDLTHASKFLDDYPEYEQGLTRILRLDATPVYAIRPSETYARNTAEKLRSVFQGFANGNNVQIASFPGYVHGRAKLISGLEVPVIYPDLRGVFGWKVKDLAAAVSGLHPVPLTPA